MLNGKDVKRIKVRGVALLGTVAAVIAWILLSYGIFTVQSSQFQMLISSNNSLNAQKLAEIDAALLKMVNYEDVTNNSALGEYNLHLDRGDLKSISVDGGWQDEIIISAEKLSKNDPDYGRFRVATINIYQDGDTKPRFSMQVPLTKSEQSYSRKTIDEFIEALRAKDKELEAKDRELEAKDRQLEAKDNEIASKIESIRSRLLAEIESGKCTCTGSTGGEDPPPPGGEDTGGGEVRPPSGDDSGGSTSGEAQTLKVIDEFGSYDLDFTWTAPIDGYIKLVSLTSTRNYREYFSAYSEPDVITPLSAAYSWSGEDGNPGYDERIMSTIDGNIHYNYSIRNVNTSYQGIQIQGNPEDYVDSPSFFSSGIPISKGSTWHLEAYGHSWQPGDATIEINWYYALVFVPKTN